MIPRNILNEIRRGKTPWCLVALRMSAKLGKPVTAGQVRSIAYIAERKLRKVMEVGA